MKTKICFQMMIDGCANYSFETESVEEPLTNEENETTAESYVFVQVQKIRTATLMSCRDLCILK
jgi:hypothetical protein